VCEGLPPGEYTVLRANPAAEARRSSSSSSARPRPFLRQADSARAAAQCSFEDGQAVCPGEAEAPDAAAAAFMAAKRNSVGALGG
jgi:hypothetical protein